VSRERLDGRYSYLLTTTERASLDTLAGIADPQRRAEVAGLLIERWQAYSRELSRIRLAALRELHDDLGLSLVDISELIGLSKQRVHQLLVAEGPESPDPDQDERHSDGRDPGVPADSGERPGRSDDSPDTETPESR